MLHLGPARDWEPPVLLTTATDREGVGDLGAAIEEHGTWSASSGALESKRRSRLRHEVESLAAERFRLRARSALEVDGSLASRLEARLIDPYRAAGILVEEAAGQRESPEAGGPAT
jgi:LAO/AO transport system kinase